MKTRILFAAALLALAACGSSARKKSAAAEAKEPATALSDGHDARTSLDYIGTYAGTFPAADCPGIEVTLRLKDDGTYTLHAEYIDRDTQFDEQGNYTVDGNLLTLDPAENSGELQYYKVEENRLRMLDADRQPVTGALADNYVLTKQN